MADNLISFSSDEEDNAVKPTRNSWFSVLSGVEQNDQTAVNVGNQRPDCFQISSIPRSPLPNTRPADLNFLLSTTQHCSNSIGIGAVSSTAPPLPGRCQQSCKRDSWIDFSSDNLSSQNARLTRNSHSCDDLVSTSHAETGSSLLNQLKFESGHFHSQSDLYQLSVSRQSAAVYSKIDDVLPGVSRSPAGDGASISRVDGSGMASFRTSLHVTLNQSEEALFSPANAVSTEQPLQRADSTASVDSNHPYDSIRLKHRSPEATMDPTNRVLPPSLPPKKSEATYMNTVGSDQHIYQEIGVGLQVKLPENKQVPQGCLAKRGLSSSPLTRPPPPKESSLPHRYSVKARSPSRRSRGSGEVFVQMPFFGDGLFDVSKERNEEITAFSINVSELRSKFCWHDHTNPGYLFSPVVPYEEGTFAPDTETAVSISTRGHVDTLQFVFSVFSRVSDIIELSLKCLSRGSADLTMADICNSFALKVCGRSEYLQENRMLIEYEYVQERLKLREPAQFVLFENDLITRSLIRMADDDLADGCPQNYKEFFQCPCTTSVARYGLSVLMEAFSLEMAKLFRETAKDNGSSLEFSPIIQSVKAICMTLASIETAKVIEAVEHLKNLQSNPTKSGSPVVSQPDVEEMREALPKLSEAVLQLVEMYCDAFDTDYTAAKPNRPGLSGSVEITAMTDNFRVNVNFAHRLPPTWIQNFDSFAVDAGIYYGGQLLCPVELTPPTKPRRHFLDHLRWECTLEFQIQVRQLPRESRLCLSLYGHVPTAKDNATTLVRRTLLGWVAIQLFNFRGVLVSGTHLLGLWPESHANPVGSCASNLLHPASVLLQLEFEQYLAEIVFPDFQEPVVLPVEETDRAVGQEESPAVYRHILTKDLFNELKPEESQLLWDHRHYCRSVPRALPLILSSAPSWEYGHLPEIYSLLASWAPMTPVDAMELLKVNFPDRRVRQTAVQWMEKLSDDELCDYLPQLVQALKYEIYHDSALARFLLRRALGSVRLMHYFFWYLKDKINEAQFGQRFQVIVGALLSVCGHAQKEEFTAQDELVMDLTEIAQKVKAARDSARTNTLQHELAQVADNLYSSLRLPMSPSLEVTGLDVRACGYYNSNSAPLKLVFKNADQFGDDIHAIFKIGDDMRQDSLAMQLIGIMNKIWLKDGLDLKMITYKCMATGTGVGMIEIVKEAETLREIHTQFGLAGSFKDEPIARWLQKHNPDEQSYRMAVENFTASCAGYCVATYVLGICDRHNDNIMLKRSGHLFHVDFAKILGNAQMFGNFRRDRAPFVLTPDMAYVINGGYEPSSRFQDFVDLCCKAFNVIRRHSNLFLNLLSLMLNSGIAHLAQVSDLSYIRDSLMPGAGEGEATANFTKLIDSSLTSFFTQVNFFIHNVAQIRDVGQLKLSGSASGAKSVLSFAPATACVAVDGLVSSARVVDHQKRYNPERYYIYVINICRVDSQTPSFVFRRYSHFHELHTKLSLSFPEIILPRLPRKIYIGRSQIRAVADRRRAELDDYVRHLLMMPPEVSESDLLYTFLHPLLHDEQEMAKYKVALLPEEKRIRERAISGQVKFSIHFERAALRVMVMHAKGLSPRSATTLADPYVKLYLLPDPIKVTKRKTKIARKTLNPTYNETLVYEDISWREIRKRKLQVTLWDHDYVGENDFLGGVLIDLAEVDLDQRNADWHNLRDLRKRWPFGIRRSLLRETGFWHCRSAMSPWILRPTASHCVIWSSPGNNYRGNGAELLANNCAVSGIRSSWSAFQVDFFFFLIQYILWQLHYFITAVLWS